MSGEEIRCCNQILARPGPGESVQCGECQSTYVTREDIPEGDPMHIDAALWRREVRHLEGNGPHVFGASFMRALAEDFEGETE